MQTKEDALKKIESLVQRFDEQKEFYKNKEYNEAQTRLDFINPFWKALGWDIDNENGYAESYREVIYEDKIKIGGATKAPDYSFRLPGGKRLFFLEAKKPSVSIYNDIQAAYQIRRYGWNAKMPISVISDFEEFAVYDCTYKPKDNDYASKARIRYLTYLEYIKEFDFIWDTFSKNAVLKGSFDKFIQSDQNKKGTTTVDQDFLQSLDKWRITLASNIALRNNKGKNPLIDCLYEEELSFVVQNIIDRIIFLRIAEDRNLEPYESLKETIKTGNYYQNLLHLFKLADKKYNSGLFDFHKDTISEKLKIDDDVIKTIIHELYYPHSPYEFSIISVEILGSAYEQFLGKKILFHGTKTRLEYKPEVRKAGGVYYTPQYIVDYIVKNTVGKLIENIMSECRDVALPAPTIIDRISKIKICDPACGSGSFLIGAYQYLLNWHKDYYLSYELQDTSRGVARNVPTTLPRSAPTTPTGELTIIEKKRILLNNIYGVDLDSNAVEVTKLSLLLKCLEGETMETVEAHTKISRTQVLPTLDNNIKCGNSLIDPDYFDFIDSSVYNEKEVVFSWENEFPEVFNRDVEFDEKDLLIKKYQQRVQRLEEDSKELKKLLTENELKKSLTENELMILLSENESMANEWPIRYRTRNFGFDCVIGNPPYVKVSDKQLFNYFSQKYEHQDYQLDLYLLFLEKYKNLLKKGGKLGVIIPNTWLQSVTFRNMRRYLVNEFYWQRILHINQHIFKAVVDTHVLIFDKNNYVKNIEVAIDIYENDEIHFHQHISQLNLPNNGEVINILQNEDEKKLFEKIKKSSIPIGEICETYNGVKPFSKGRGTPPQTEKIMKEKPYIVVGQEKPAGKNWLPLLRGSLMNRYINLWNNNSWIQYGEWLAEPRNPKIFEAEEKIVVRQTGDSIIATIIGVNIICRNNLHIIISNEINHKFILGILNSKLTNFYYYQINPEKGEALAEVKKQHVDQLPIPTTVSSQKETETIQLVDQLLQLNKELQSEILPNKKNQIQARIRYCEDKIDKMVYELYGLTEAEIRIVEGK